jgi:hypothetical protein
MSLNETKIKIKTWALVTMCHNEVQIWFIFKKEDALSASDKFPLPVFVDPTYSNIKNEEN